MAAEAAGEVPTSRSISCLIRQRARCSRTRWFSALMSSSAQVSPASRPSVSRSRITARWPAGNRSITARACSQSWRPATTRSGSSSSHKRGASAQCPLGRNWSSGRPRSPGAVPSISAPRPTSRPSRATRVRARFRTMLKIHVTRLDRPSNRATPPYTASHESCTTSSAWAWLPMMEAARRTSEAWKRRTSARYARGSPFRRRARKAGSSNAAEEDMARISPVWAVRRRTGDQQLPCPGMVGERRPAGAATVWPAADEAAPWRPWPRGVTRNAEGAPRQGAKGARQ